MARSSPVLLPRRLWSDAEDAILRQDYRATSGRAVAERLGRTADAVIRRAMRLGLTHHPARRVSWTPERLALIRTHLATTPRVELAEMLGCTHGALHRQIEVMGLGRGKGECLTRAQERIAGQLIGTAPNWLIAERLGCKRDAIWRLAARLGGSVDGAVRHREQAYRDDLARLRVLLAHARGMLTIVEAATILGVSYAEVSRALVTEAIAGAGLAPTRTEAGR